MLQAADLLRLSLAKAELFRPSLGDGPRLLPFGGSAPASEIRRAFRYRPQAAIDHGIWFLDVWPNNHFHWLATILPRALVARRMLPNSPLLIPHDGLITPVMRRSLSAIGCVPGDILEVGIEPCRVKALAFVCSDLSDGRLQVELRQAVLDGLRIAGRPTGRRLYVTRRTAKWRRILNEALVLDLVRELGFQVVDPSVLSFDEQVQVFSEANMVVSTHGAGLANILFSPAGTRVFEICNPDLPNPDYYILATNLGHSYSLHAAIPARQRAPAYDDLTVRIDDLKAALVGAAVAMGT